ncbi:MAG: radical SAM protein [Pseudomonadota bacterium]
MGRLTDAVKPLANLARGRPVLAVLEVTLRCNSACGYCDLPLNQGRYELSREEIQRIGRQLYAGGVRFLLIQGGEPLVRKDLLEILHDLRQLGFAITLVTNGTRLRQRVVDVLTDLEISVSVSLDTLDRERYRAIRGADQLPIVLAGIERLAEYSHAKYLTCIVSDLNRDDAASVVDFATRRGFVPVVGAYHWEVERYGKLDDELKYERAQAKAVFQHLLDTDSVPPGYFRSYIRDNVRWLNGDSLPRCDAGRHSIAIDASGNVAPCLALQHAGNLRFESLAAILARFDQERIRGCSNASSCNMMCSRVVGSLLRNPLQAARMAAQPGK